MPKSLSHLRLPDVLSHTFPASHLEKAASDNLIPLEPKILIGIHMLSLKPFSSINVRTQDLFLVSPYPVLVIIKSSDTNDLRGQVFNSNMPGQVQCREREDN